MRLKRAGIVLELERGDIASQDDLDAVVNAANAELMPGGGVAGAIHRGAGPGLAEECRPLAPIDPGQSVITGAHELPNRYVVHALGPVYGRDQPADRLLTDAYRNALRVADEQGVESIGFPAISTGAFGYPIGEAAAISLRACIETLPELSSIRLIRFILHSAKDLTVYENALSDVAKDSLRS